MRNIQLAEHILELILLRLPVIDILRSKSVCKKWNFIISTPHFVQLHLKKANSYPSDNRILIRSGDYKYTSINSDDIYGDHIMIGDLPLPCNSGVNLLSSCDGLICFFNYLNQSICVWNPATRSSKSLKTIKSISNVVYHWFGHESADNDEYKLVILASSRDGGIHINLIRPYVDEEDCGSTQLLNYKYLYFPGNASGTLFHGRVHWFACKHIVDEVTPLVPVVFSYDLRLKTIEEVQLPDEGMSRYATICVTNGCISAIQTRCRGKECTFEVWTMKEYGVKESWAKSTVFDCSNDILSCGSVCVLDDLRIALIGTTAEGDLIVIVGWKNLVLCDLRDFKCKTLLANCSVDQIIMYVETLVSP